MPDNTSDTIVATAMEQLITQQSLQAMAGIIYRTICTITATIIPPEQPFVDLVDFMVRNATADLREPKHFPACHTCNDAGPREMKASLDAYRSDGMVRGFASTSSGYKGTRWVSLPPPISQYHIRPEFLLKHVRHTLLWREGTGSLHGILDERDRVALEDNITIYEFLLTDNLPTPTLHAFVTAINKHEFSGESFYAQNFIKLRAKSEVGEATVGLTVKEAKEKVQKLKYFINGKAPFRCRKFLHIRFWDIASNLCIWSYRHRYKRALNTALANRKLS